MDRKANLEMCDTREKRYEMQEYKYYMQTAKAIEDKDGWYKYTRHGRKEVTYDDLCHELGIDAKSGFLEITQEGKITFSCGRPSEISSLFIAVCDAGYKPDKRLIWAAERQGYWYERAAWHKA